MTDDDLSGRKGNPRGSRDGGESHEGRDNSETRRTFLAPYDSARPALLGPRDGFDPGVAWSAVEADEAVDYSAVFRRLWRRKGLLSLFTLLGVGIAAAITMQMPSHYVAHASVAIGDPLGGRVAYGTSRNATPSAPPDTSTVQTEVEVLTSPQLALEVVRDLKLQDDPEINPAAAPSGSRFGLSHLKRWLFPPASNAAPRIDAAAEISQTVQNFLHRLQVSVKGTSRVIDIAFDSSDPRLAMKVANAVVDHYVNNQLELRFQATERASTWLKDKVTRLQAKVQDAELAVEKFRAKAGLFSTPNGSPLLLKQLTDVSAELANAQSASAALDARLSQLKASVESPVKGRSGAGTALVDSPFMRSLDTQEADAEQRLAEASATMGDRNPTTMGLRERLQHIRGAMKNEAQRVIASLESDLKVARMKEQDLTQRRRHIQDEIAQMNNSEITLRTLEREAQADRLILNNFVSRFKEASQEADLSSQSADAKIVSYAQLPVHPDRPKKELLILMAGMASLICGGVLVHLVERADRSLRSLDEVENHLKTAGLGMIPISKSAELSPSQAARYGSSYREAVKATYSRLFWTREAPQVTVVTSAFANEGKTTLALSLAAMAAQGGQRVVLLDADFWKKGASVAMGIATHAGLAELLEGKARLADTIVSDVASGTDVIAPGRFSRASLIAWIGNLAGLLESLRNQYDVVIIDTPPVFSVPEATLLASHADATVMTVRWGSTSREGARAALKKLRDASAHLVGTVVTMVHEREHAKYGYTEATYTSRVAAHGPSTGAMTLLAAWRAGLPGGGLAAVYRGLTSRGRLPRDPASRRDGTRNRDDASSHALLVLDMQEGFTGPGGRCAPPEAAASRLIDTINGAAQLAARAGMGVLYAYQKIDGSGTRPLSRLLPRSGGCDREADARPDSRLKPVPGQTFLKRGGNAFSSPEFEDFLHRNGVTHLFLVGVDGATSVSQTARSALDRGYRVTFVRDGIFTVCEEKWERLLEAFESDAAFAVTSEEFAEFAMALRQADTIPA
jgi:capsular exopolysaccharide synthesis family protein